MAEKKKVFAGIIELKILRCGDYHGLFGWTLSIITYILIRGKQRETTPQKRGQQCEDRGREWSDVATSKRILVAAKRQKRRGIDSSLEFTEGKWLC